MSIEYNAIFRIDDDVIKLIAPMAFQRLSGFLSDNNLTLYHLAETITYNCHLDTLYDYIPDDLDEEMDELYYELARDLEASTGLPIELHKTSEEDYGFGIDIFQAYQPRRELTQLRILYDIPEDTTILDPEGDIDHRPY